MNPSGNAATLYPAHPGNVSAVKSGVYSRTGRVLAPRAAEIAEALMEAPHTVELDRIAAEEIGQLVALVEAYPRFVPHTGGCEGLLPNVFRADLDYNPPPVTPIRGDSAQPAGFPRVISQDRPEEWHIKFVTAAYDVNWVAFIDWTSSGRTGSTKITDHGKPFRTAATYGSAAASLLTRYARDLVGSSGMMCRSHKLQTACGRTITRRPASANGATPKLAARNA